MRRHSAWLQIFGVIIVISACNSLQIQQPFNISDADWLVSGSTPQRPYAVDVFLDPPLVNEWQYNAGGGFGPGSPLIMGNYVFVATRNGEIHAIDFDTGKKRGQKSFGDAIEGSPVIHDGVLYVPVEWGGRPVQAYDLASANARWKVKTIPIDAGLVLVDDRLIGADIEGNVRAYDIQNGEILWEKKLGERIGVHAAPILTTGGLVAIAGDNGQVFGLDVQDGETAWWVELPSPVYDAPASSGQWIFVPTTRGRFFAIDAATGAIRWQYAIRDTAVYLTSPAVSESDVVFGGSDGILRSVATSTGEVRWTYEAGAAITAAPLITHNTIYIGTMGREIQGVDRKSGKLVWVQELKGRIKSALAARDDRLIVLAEPRLVYMFRKAHEE